MSEYKDTLNLPKTSFPMKANLAQREPEMLEHWQKIGLYQQLCTKGKGHKPFILHDGPPYANGSIHLGHAVNKILKDIVIKSRRLSGYNAPFVPGWDCHGLPIEHNVEKKIGKAGSKVDIATFYQKCREYAAKQIETQKKDFMRLGVLGEWDKPYQTMDKLFEADVIRALGKVIENGHLKRGYKPVYWSVVGGSALAEAEIEYQDKQSEAIDVAYPVTDCKRLCDIFKVSCDEQCSHCAVIIWTTTPWTLPSSQAVTVGAAIEYGLISFKRNTAKMTMVVASELAGSLMERLGVNHYKILATCQGADLEHLQVNHPFYDKQLPIILGDHVTLDAGTGCVHTAPDHGADDYSVGRAYGIETLNLVSDNGVFSDKTPLFAGQHVYKVDQAIIDLLVKKDQLLHHETITHSYPHCWRTKTPLIFRATPQWFISMNQNNLLQSMNEQIDSIAFTPDWGRNRLEGMLAASPDWCISRQRLWGTPITLLLHKETGELHPRMSEIIEHIAQRVEQEGMGVWQTLNVDELLSKDEAGQYTKTMDTLDVWFDAGVSHFAVLDRNEALHHPADLYLEGSDQHRGWFQSSLKTGVAINGTAPYKALLTHGFVVDGNGRKMSKSLGNIISPQSVINKLGADVLRLWVSGTEYSTEMTVSDEILKRSTDVYRRIRNTARFLLSNLNGFDPDHNLVGWQEMLPLDQWVVDKAFQLQQQLVEAYEAYDFISVYQKIHHFCALDLGGFYLDIIKDRQYTTQQNSRARRSCQTAMFHVIEALVRWIAPVLSFTAEEIWQVMPGKRGASVHLSNWYDQLESLPERGQRQEWEQILKVKNAVNKALENARKDGTLGGSLEADVVLYASDELQENLKKLDDELRFVLITSRACVAHLDEADDAIVTELEGLHLNVKSSASTKCARCWHRTDDVGQDSEHPELCLRCVANVSGQGETRRYA